MRKVGTPKKVLILSLLATACGQNTSAPNLTLGQEMARELNSQLTSNGVDAELAQALVAGAQSEVASVNKNTSQSSASVASPQIAKSQEVLAVAPYFVQGAITALATTNLSDADKAQAIAKIAQSFATMLSLNQATGLKSFAVNAEADQIYADLLASVEASELWSIGMTKISDPAQARQAANDVLSFTLAALDDSTLLEVESSLIRVAISTSLSVGIAENNSEYAQLLSDDMAVVESTVGASCAKAQDCAQHLVQLRQGIQGGLGALNLAVNPRNAAIAALSAGLTRGRTDLSLSADDWQNLESALDQAEIPAA